MYGLSSGNDDAGSDRQNRKDFVMAGMFEVFLDADSQFRFLLKAPDGAVMAVSGAFPDRSAVAAAIAAVRECAGTGLVTDLSAGSRDRHTPMHAPVLVQPASVPAAIMPAAMVPAASVPAPALRPGASEPARDEHFVPVSRVRAFAHFNAVRGRVSGARWTGAV
jgi:uncharacterized protein